LLLCLSLLVATACASDSIAGPRLAPEPEPNATVQAICCSLGDSPREPIYIIDGAITFSAQVIENLKAEDILSVEVIKVIDDGSPYDKSRAKRSVVIITTRGAASRRR
jgi:4-hydroxy-3-methylbut-2-enyl diphosphate reductase IspH